MIFNIRQNNKIDTEKKILINSSVMSTKIQTGLNMSDENKEILDQVTELISSQKKEKEEKIMTRKLFKKNTIQKKTT